MRKSYSIMKKLDMFYCVCTSQSVHCLGMQEKTQSSYPYKNEVLPKEATICTNSQKQFILYGRASNPIHRWMV